MITIVSGLPRSGTSLAMQMLAAGGMPVLTDDARHADDSNPRGYFEFARTMRLPAGDRAWQDEAEGHAVKITWPLLMSVPADWPARIVWLDRTVAEIVGSQEKMLARMGQRAGDAAQLSRAFSTMRTQAKAWLTRHRNRPFIELEYRRLLVSPAGEVARLAIWLDGELDTAAMIAAVDPALWRERAVST
jgi:hypothetical protein